MSLSNTDILRWLQLLAQTFSENSSYLTQLDSAIGDADHGANMERGFSAVRAKLPDLASADISTILKAVGTTLVSTVGGASGPLYGTAFLRASAVTSGKQTLEAADFINLLNAAIEGIKARGKAQPGEKTMLDALVPALAAARKAQTEQLDLAQVVRQASDAAETGMKDTIPLLATKGRASYLGERSIGHQDPGATSSWFLLKTFADICAG